MVLLLLLSLTPGQAQPGDAGFSWLIEITPKLLQKSMHIVCYAGLACLCIWTLRSYTNRATAIYVYSALIPLLYGALLEWAQMLVPGRFSNILDIILNATGIALATAVAVLFYNRVIRRDT